MMQFDWHIQPCRLEVCGGTAAKPLGVGGFGVVRALMKDGPFHVFVVSGA